MLTNLPYCKGAESAKFLEKHGACAEPQPWQRNQVVDQAACIALVTNAQGPRLLSRAGCACLNLIMSALLGEVLWAASG